MTAGLAERLGAHAATVRRADLHRRRGRVTDLIGLIVEATGLEAEVGEVCEIETGRDRPPTPAEVVGFRAGRTLLMPLGELVGIGPGDRVTAMGAPVRVPTGASLLGRVLDGLGRPIDGGPPLALGDDLVLASVEASPPSPMERPRITDRVSLGVRALDALVPCGRGQRLGIFAGSGVGKSSLLGMIARATEADVNVICLVGERGREVREFLDRDLGPEGLARSVVVVATSDQPALVRIKAALTATTIAESFRDMGADVLLMMDSVTRFAMAQREIGLAIGEPPATRGYTPSVFALLPKLLERSGTSALGSITGLYTVLVDGDDMNEPIADAVRSILDGHVVLTRELAHQGHYPAVDVLQSVSRLVGEIMDPAARAAATELRALMAAEKDKRDLVAIGAYERGTDPVADRAIDLKPAIDAFLKQTVDERPDALAADAALAAVVGGAAGVVPGIVEGSVAADPAVGLPADPQHAASPSAIPPLNLAV
ncbi:FliI/YscN family ATPase [Paraconexibacter algicola]|uniref:Flagellum-specific ATP synthase FliI n=1 Tax=Paraconexibacter algicola TaxID=2133960 RepID=A0A2T4UIW4_9ACTN|nr:FliI/YscN family ATPase [Paraconexibacter algicola]PTL59173.1 flagellum-specific ATP synthase FliI [Paraconexibacter algicola]